MSMNYRNIIALVLCSILLFGAACSEVGEGEDSKVEEASSLEQGTIDYQAVENETIEASDWLDTNKIAMLAEMGDEKLLTEEISDTFDPNDPHLRTVVVPFNKPDIDEFWDLSTTDNIERDTYIWVYNPNTNYYSEPYTYVGYALGRLRSLFGDYTCPSEHIVDASLHLRISENNADNSGYYVIRVNDPWMEGSVTWNTQPTYGDGNNYTPISSTATGWVEFNATTAVKEACESGLPNNGLLLVGQGTTDTGYLVFYEIGRAHV